ncbi:MAG: LPP20 family lipoprotein [Deltaproteobacteria bacterium]|nr:LPP20 family lipoprotein [Deltaproteobacteria bacterium]
MRIVLKSTFFTVLAIIATSSTVFASDLPKWVNRGSSAFNNSGSRAFYGVGSASGIKNPALLRSTADNRARSEVAKVFETFSASLMKDYMNSDGAQNVEQAVKTFSAMSLEGVEVRDRYIDSDGTMYSLAVLDIDQVAAAVKKAKAQGIVKSHVKPVTLDDIFDRHSKKAEPQKPIAKSGGDGSASKAPSNATSSTQQKKGGKPDWIDGEDSRFPYREFLCAVGYASKRGAAENAAYAALAKVFVAHVESASSDFMGAYSRTGAPSLEVQASATLTKVSTEKLFSGVRIPEVWQDPQSTIFALSCLERAKSASILKKQIGDLDGTVERSISRASDADAQARLKHLSRALDALRQREALNNELRLIDYDGVGISSQYAPYDVAAALEQTQEQLLISVVADGPNAEDFRNALVDSLTSQGYQITDGDGADANVLISANIRMEDGGKGTGSAAKLHFVRGVVMLTVKNVKSGKSIGSFKEYRKEGHRSAMEAERRVVRELAKKLAGSVGKKIDATMKGKR